MQEEIILYKTIAFRKDYIYRLAIVPYIDDASEEQLMLVLYNPSIQLRMFEFKQNPRDGDYPVMEITHNYLSKIKDESGGFDHLFYNSKNGNQKLYFFMQIKFKNQKIIKEIVENINDASYLVLIIDEKKLKFNGKPYDQKYNLYDFGIQYINNETRMLDDLINKLEDKIKDVKKKIERN